MPSTNNGRSRRSAQNRQRSVMRVPRSPPSVNASIRFTQVLRFKVWTAVASIKTVQRQDLLNAYVMVINPGSLVAARIFHAVKVNRITMWAEAGAGTDDFDAVDISVTWLSNYGPASVKTDSGNAFNTASMISKPPRQSLASYWSLTGSGETETLFQLGVTQTSTAVAIPKGFILDIHCSFVSQAAFSDNFNYINTGTFAAGTIYRTALGELGNSSPAWIPVGHASIN